MVRFENGFLQSRGVDTFFYKVVHVLMKLLPPQENKSSWWNMYIIFFELSNSMYNVGLGNNAFFLFIFAALKSIRQVWPKSLEKGLSDRNVPSLFMTIYQTLFITIISCCSSHLG